MNASGFGETAPEKVDPWLVTWEFGEQTFEVIRNYAETVEFPARATIFSKGDLSDAMFLILEGMVLVMSVDEQGREKTVSIITEGQSFGEVGVLVQQPRLATCVAGLDTRLLKITPAVLEKLEKERPELIIKLYKVLAQTLANQWLQARQAIK